MAIDPTTENLLGMSQDQSTSVDQVFQQAFPTAPTPSGSNGNAKKSRQKASTKLAVPRNRYLRGLVPGFRQKKNW